MLWYYCFSTRNDQMNPLTLFPNDNNHIKSFSIALSHQIFIYMDIFVQLSCANQPLNIERHFTIASSLIVSIAEISDSIHVCVL